MITMIDIEYFNQNLTRDIKTRNLMSPSTTTVFSPFLARVSSTEKRMLEKEGKGERERE